MANNFIDLIYSKDAIKGAKEAHDLLSSTHDIIVKMSGKSLDLYGGQSPKNLKDLNTSIKQSIELTNGLSEAEQKLLTNTNKLLTAQGKQLQNQIKENNLAKSTIDLKNKEEAARLKNEKALEREQQKLAAAVNLYNKTQRQLNSVQAAYNNLAAKKERYNNLTDQEEKRLNTLQRVTEKYNTTLKGVDATVGKHTRNVGNYASAFNPLSNSINQLTREAPAFANSIQTGFMAISNNLPIFFDAISNTQKEIKALRAEGQKVPGLFQQLTSSLFSFGTALSVGVTLLTLYGKEIVEWASSLFKASTALDAVKDSTKALNDIRLESQKSITQEQVTLENYLKTAKDDKLTREERLIAVKKLQELYPFYFKNLTEEEILLGKTAKAHRDITAALLARAKSDAAVTKITENQSKVIDLEETRLSLTKQLTEAQIRASSAAKATMGDMSRGDAAAFRAVQTQGNVEEIKKKILKTDKEIAYWTEVNTRLTSYASDELDKSIGLDYKAEKQREKKIKQQKELEDVETNSAEAFNRNIKALEEQLNVTSRIDNATGQLNPKYAFLEFQLKLLKDAYEALYGEQKKQEEITKKQVKFGTEEYYEGRIAALKAEQRALADNTQEYKLYDRAIEAVQIDLDILRGKTKETTEKLYDFKAFFKGFVDEFGSSSGFSKLMFLFSEDFKKFEGNAAATALAISDAFQQAFNTINSYSEANYQKELSRLENQKNIAIQFAGDSTAAKQEIERQYEAKRKQIERQRAEQAKRAAIFNAVIDTAQAVIGTLAATPPPAGIPLAVLVGALGAAQIALIASQPIPAYAEGTLNHSGGAMLINDGKGSNYTETVVTPDGKAKQYKGRNVLVDAPKGTKVFTHNQWNEELNSMLNLQGIGYANRILPNIDISGNGLTKEDLSNEISRLANVIRSKQSIEIVRDARGERIFQKEQGQRKEILNARAHIKGFDV